MFLIHVIIQIVKNIKPQDDASVVELMSCRSFTLVTDGILRRSGGQVESPR